MLDGVGAAREPGGDQVLILQPGCFSLRIVPNTSMRAAVPEEAANRLIRGGSRKGREREARGQCQQVALNGSPHWRDRKEEAAGESLARQLGAYWKIKTALRLSEGRAFGT